MSTNGKTTHSFTVQQTRRESPIRVLLHGKGGLGKSTFASNAPRAVFITSEDGLGKIDAMALTPYPETWEDMLAQIDYVGELDYKTLAIDTLDWFEPMCWEYVCQNAIDPQGRKKPKKDIESFGYGKGYTAALEQWRVALNKLGRLHSKGKNIVLLAHSVRKPYKNPMGDDYEHWTVKLHEKTANLLKEWVDVVGYCEEQVEVVEVNGRNKGLSSGKRIIRTQPHAAYDVKTRYMMPKTVPLDWTAFERAVIAGSQSPVLRLKGDLEAKLAELGNEVVSASALSFLTERGENVAALTEAVQTVDEYLADLASKSA